MKRLYRKGRKFGDWTLTSFKGGGGNGEVWACVNSANDEKAIKLLKRIKPKSYNRFVDETTVLEQNSDVVGIIPIEEKHLPKKINESTPYFIMPLAEPSENKLKDKSIEEKIDAIIQVAESLQELHKRKIYHRDIKPANILYYNSRFSLADFGLVDYAYKGNLPNPTAWFNSAFEYDKRGTLKKQTINLYRNYTFHDLVGLYDDSTATLKWIIQNPIAENFTRKTISYFNSKGLIERQEEYYCRYLEKRVGDLYITTYKYEYYE